MKTFLAYWIVFQLIMIGFAGGGLWRELVRNGCIVDKEIDREIVFYDYIAPFVLPMVFLTGDLSNEYCKK
jgi:hypothetical protein